MAKSRLDRRYSVKPDKPDERDYLYRPAAVTLPEQVDLRLGFSSIYDQGQLGSCTANAVAAALDFNRKRQGEEFINPSRLFIYWVEREHDGNTTEDAGSSIRESVKAVKDDGACPELEWPYIINKFADKPSVECFASALNYQDLTYLRVRKDSFTIKSCLAQGYPVIVGIDVYESFESADVAKTGLVPLPSPSEQLLGGHAVLCVGYLVKDGKQYWLMRNSWGMWGDQGYFYLPQGYLLGKLGGDYWSLRKVE